MHTVAEGALFAALLYLIAACSDRVPGDPDLGDDPTQDVGSDSQMVVTTMELAPQLGIAAAAGTAESESYRMTFRVAAPATVTRATSESTTLSGSAPLRPAVDEEDNR